MSMLHKISTLHFGTKCKEEIQELKNNVLEVQTSKDKWKKEVFKINTQLMAVEQEKISLEEQLSESKQDKSVYDREFGKLVSENVFLTEDTQRLKQQLIEAQSRMEQMHIETRAKDMSLGLCEFNTVKLSEEVAKLNARCQGLMTDKYQRDTNVSSTDGNVTTLDEKLKQVREWANEFEKERAEVRELYLKTDGTSTLEEYTKRYSDYDRAVTKTSPETKEAVTEVIEKMVAEGNWKVPDELIAKANEYAPQPTEIPEAIVEPVKKLNREERRKRREERREKLRSV